jgi:hypothetical protein
MTSCFHQLKADFPDVYQSTLDRGVAMSSLVSKAMRRLQLNYDYSQPLEGNCQVLLDSLRKVAPPEMKQSLSKDLVLHQFKLPSLLLQGVSSSSVPPLSSSSLSLKGVPKKRPKMEPPPSVIQLAKERAKNKAQLEKNQQSQTSVVRLLRSHGKTFQDCDVYIGSGRDTTDWKLPASIWANPFKVNSQQTNRRQVLEKYRDYVLSRGDLMKQLPSLYGKKLGCWCHNNSDSSKPAYCHGDVLLQLLHKYRGPPE